jgi:iron complex transport system substrate-binding protein
MMVFETEDGGRSMDVRIQLLAQKRSRRQVVAAAAALALLSAPPVAARQDATPESGEWTYTDDVGVTINRPTPPERIVAYLPIGSALWDYGLRPVGVYGTTRRPDGTPEVFAGNIDLESVESLGETYGEMDLEKLVALKPDIVINDRWYDAMDLWGLEPSAAEQVGQIAPIAEIKFTERPVTDTLASVVKLAVALGADPEAPEIVESKKAFEEAVAELEAAIAEKPGLKVMFMSGTAEQQLYVANPKQSADMTLYQSLGLDIVVPEVPPEEYWEELSWEQAGKYEVDLFLIDSRQWSATGEQLMAIPTFASLPAAKAGAFGAWDIEYVPSYQGFTPVIKELTEVIRNADPDIV